MFMDVCSYRLTASLCDSFSLWKVAMDRAVNSDPVDTADTGRMFADIFLMTKCYDI